MAALRAWAWAWPLWAWPLWACGAALCVVVAVAEAPAKTGQPRPPAPQLPCSCRREADWVLDCAGRERSALTPNDTCSGRTSKADLSNNRFADPVILDPFIVDANLSRNLLTALPCHLFLSNRTHTLDVSFNRIAHSDTELRHFGALRTLAVSGNQLQSLGFLPEHCQLISLSADRNQLRSTEVQGPLNGCSKLERLDLSYNQLGPLHHGALAGLRSLRRLNLANAGISRINANAFHDVHNLQFLFLSSNQLTTLPPRLFSPLKELEQLRLDSNQIVSLPADVFTGMKNVEVISLDKNKLSQLTLGIFSGLEKLKYIFLNHNQLTTLPNGIFAGLKNLEGVGLPSNQLETLPKGVFSGLPSLKFVGLNENKLTTLPAGLLEGIKSLELLDLGVNQFTSVPEGLLRGVKTVEILDLSSNRLTAISAGDLAGPDNIKRLDLTGNLLKEVPTYSASWPQVEGCFLERNAVTEAREAALRSWLGDGSRKRALVLGKEPRLRSLSALRWALDGRQANATVDDVDCSCGRISRGRAFVSFCAAVVCPRPTRDWKEAARRLEQRAHKG